MINNRNKIAAILALVLLLCMLAALPAAANSAPRYWEGVSASGAILSTGDCPLVVEHEELIFEISEFPANYFNSAEEFLAYDASVRAEYTFYNPTDLQVTATLLFPFGVNPYYVNNYDPETGEYVRIDTSDRFGAQVDGAAVQTTVRHSYWNGSVYHFNPVDEMKTLYDTYRTDNFLAYDLPVYVYKYQFEGVDRQTYSAACAALHVGDLPKGTRLMVDDMRGWHSDEGGESGWLSVSCSDSEAVLYVLGEDIGLVEWSFFENGALETEIEGSANVLYTETTTFGELAMQSYDPASGVSAYDWFNAVVAQIDYSERVEGTVYGNTSAFINISENLLEWYEYEITLEPGQRLVNTVTAPLYPNIDGGYEDPVYTYEYLTSPASLWAEFGTLDIRINTPYVMVKERKGDFSIAPKMWTKTDAGYELHLDGLPEDEVIFSLCRVENPKWDFNPYAIFMLLLILTPVLIVLAVIALLITVVVLIVRKIKRRKSKKSGDA